ncbi:hypothetical protein [Kribbella sp. CA-293567]|uniref:hypothetical protein n=1 Tax=Kribbella sp. CA-293567 TaxID=3002436 RepID=UPI0022DD4310|nr:hypothetical protein [Kribbella sp. CA-293567]WBQ05704.1 hypothetical protein OX958_02620 [Kribbella sp. CA-293567]
MRVLESRPVRVVTGLLAVAAMVASGTQTAAADASVPYLRTDPTAYPSGYGYARAGSITFSSIHRASYYFEVHDQCDGSGQGDGFAAMIRGRVILGDGAVSAWSAWEGDNTGCGDGGLIAMHGWTSQRRIVRMEIQFCLRKPTGTVTGRVQPSWRNQYA